MMSEESVGLLAIISVMWIGWPPYQISKHLSALRKIAEGKNLGQ